MKNNINKRLSGIENRLSPDSLDERALEAFIQDSRRSVLRGLRQYRIRATPELVDAHLIRECREIVDMIQRSPNLAAPQRSAHTAAVERQIELIGLLPWPEVNWNEEDESWPFLAIPR
jgi:hypothetical protein